MALSNGVAPREKFRKSSKSKSKSATNFVRTKSRQKMINLIISQIFELSYGIKLDQIWFVVENYSICDDFICNYVNKIRKNYVISKLHRASTPYRSNSNFVL